MRKDLTECLVDAHGDAIMVHHIGVLSTRSSRMHAQLAGRLADMQGEVILVTGSPIEELSTRNCDTMPNARPMATGSMSKVVTAVYLIEELAQSKRADNRASVWALHRRKVMSAVLTTSESGHHVARLADAQVMPAEHTTSKCTRLDFMRRHPICTGITLDLGRCPR